MQHMVHCCPKLQRLTLQPSREHLTIEEDLEAGFTPEDLVQLDHSGLGDSLGALPGLADLQELTLPFVGPPLPPQGWAALAACSRLVRLSVRLDARSPLGVMRGLTQLRQLTRLEVRAAFGQRDSMCDCSCKDSTEVGAEVRVAGVVCEVHEAVPGLSYTHSCHTMVAAR